MRNERTATEEIDESKGSRSSEPSCSISWQTLPRSPCNFTADSTQISQTPSCFLFLLCTLVLSLFVSLSGRALKTVVQGLLLSNESEKLHSMNLLLYMAPITICLLLPASLILEGNVLGKVINKAQENPLILILLFANATMAYLTNLTNFLVTKHTSALTLQVCSGTFQQSTVQYCLLSRARSAHH